ncbi:MAG: response regulator transcription factor [Duodenibacillus sp.]|nr:response regulator transcription factor [Duodenibacillus sp.]
MQERPLILVVDDETKIRRLVATSLEEYGFDVLAAADAEQAIEIFSRTIPRPDLVVLDIMLPGMDGFACANKLHAVENVPIVFLSARNEGNYKMQGFNAGADDYVTKPFSIDELVARIRAVLRRSGLAKSVVAREYANGPMRLFPDTRKVLIGSREIRLADTEFRLLLELMKHPGSVITHEHLLATVWGSEAIGEVKYLRVAFARIRRKLEDAGLEGGVISAYSGVGYILRDLVQDPL